MTPPSAPPSVSGTLETRPFPRLLLQLFRKRVTGVATVCDETGDRSQLFLREGFTVHIDSSNDLDRLDRILLDSGMVSRAVMARAEQLMADSGMLLGQALIELGAVDARVMHDAVKAQLRRKLKRLFFIRRGTFEVTVCEHAFGQAEDLQRTRIDPRPILYPGIRTAYDDARLITELAPLQGYAFKLTKLPPGFLEGMGLSMTEAVVRAVASRELQLSDLSTLEQRPSECRAAVLALLYADLLAVRPLDASAGPGPGQSQSLAPLGGPGERPSARMPIFSPVPGPPGGGSFAAPPDPLPAQAAGDPALRARIEDLYARMDRATHFEIFDLSEAASPEQVQTAYMKAVKTFHPDRVAGLGMTDLLGKAEQLLARMTEARDVLTDGKRRTEYVRKLRGEKTEAETARDILEAEELFKAGEMAMARGEYTGAQALFSQAVKKNPSETEYRAYLAWTRYMENPTRRSLLARETARIIAESIKERPNFVRGFFWQGEIANHAGDAEAAEAAYLKCLTVDPKFLDAERALRLIEMRRKKQSAGKAADGKASPGKKPEGGSIAGKASGLLSKFLKR